MLENRLLLRVWSKKAHKYLTDADIWDIFDSDAEDVWELLSEVNRPTTKFLEQQLREYKLTFEQCTGLKDKNDKLIYEGDIVNVTQFYNGVPTTKKRAIKVLYKFGRFNVHDVSSCYLEIIGNIHENSELLEEKEN